MPGLEPYLIEPIWQQLCELLPEREVDHPLGCHRPLIPARMVFEKLVQVLVFGCAYHRIADEICSATTLRKRRDEWIEIEAMDALHAWCELRSPSQHVGEGQPGATEPVVEPDTEDSPMIVKARKPTVAETMAVRGFGRVRELCIASNIG